MFVNCCFILQVEIPGSSISFDPRVTDKVTLQYESYAVIPRNSTWTAVPQSLASKPIYWSLPDSYLGDWVYKFIQNSFITMYNEFQIKWKVWVKMKVSKGKGLSYFILVDLIVQWKDEIWGWIQIW